MIVGRTVWQGEAVFMADRQAFKAICTFLISWCNSCIDISLSLCSFIWNSSIYTDIPIELQILYDLSKYNIVKFGKHDTLLFQWSRYATLVDWDFSMMELTRIIQYILIV